MSDPNPSKRAKMDGDGDDPVPPGDTDTLPTSTSTGDNHEDEPESEDSEEDSEKTLGSEDDGDLFHIDVEGHPASAEDKEFLIKLTNSLLRFMGVAVSSIVDDIISQNHVGSVIKNFTNDAGVMGVCTALISIQDQPSESLDKVYDWILDSWRKSSEEKKLDKTFETIISASRTGGDCLGFLICDRFVNITPKASLAQLSGLVEEIDYDLVKHLIMVQKVYRDDQSDTMKYQLVEQDLLEKYVVAAHEVRLDPNDYGMIFEEDPDGEPLEGFPYRRFVIIRSADLKKYVEDCTAQYPN
jgi:hypothetical protein